MTDSFPDGPGRPWPDPHGISGACDSLNIQRSVAGNVWAVGQTQTIEGLAPILSAGSSGSLGPYILIKSFLSTALRFLHIIISGLETPGLFFRDKGFPNKCLLAVSLGYAAFEKFGWAFDQSPNLRVLWGRCLATFFLVMSFWIQYGAHFQ